MGQETQPMAHPHNTVSYRPHKTKDGVHLDNEVL